MNGSCGLGFAAYRIRPKDYATKQSGTYTYEFKIPISFMPKNISLSPDGGAPSTSTSFKCPIGCTWRLNTAGATSNMCILTINNSKQVTGEAFGQYTDRYQATYSSGYLTINLQGKNGVIETGIYQYDDYTIIASQIETL